MIWYAQHRECILSHHDQFLAEYDITSLHRMPRTVQRVWIRHLDSARRAYENERRQRALDQNVITRYFPSRSPPNPPTTQGPVPTSASSHTRPAGSGHQRSQGGHGTDDDSF
jgi:hypothetical protein